MSGENIRRVLWQITNVSMVATKLQIPSNEQLPKRSSRSEPLVKDEKTDVQFAIVESLPKIT